jgi:hypothetical protein
MAQLERGRQVDQRLGVPEQQVSAGSQLLLEGVDHGALAFGVEVDQHVPAQDHVERPEQRDLRAIHQVQVDEIHVLLDVVGDAPDAVLLGEVARAQARVGLAEGALPVGALARALEHAARDVRRVDAQVRGGVDAGLDGEDHDAVGLLAARAARGPDRDRAAAALAALEQRLGQDLSDQRLELAPLAEEVGLVGRDLVDEPAELPAARGRAAQLEVIGGVARDAEVAHAPLDPALQQEARLGPEVEPAMAADELREHAELAVAHAQLCVVRPCHRG